MKTCTKCEETKSLTEFRKYGYCKSCEKKWHAANFQKNKTRMMAKNKQYRLANPEKSAIYDLRARLKKFGMTVEDYNALLLRQNGVCAICKSSDPGRADALRLFVDHSYETGKVRGLLCHGCNAGIGLLKEDPAIFIAAMNYLK